MCSFKIFCNLNLIAFILCYANRFSMKSFLNINTILVYFAGASLCYLQSCYDPNSNVDCNDTETITRNISTDDLSKVPYTGFDTLYFLNKQGDTCIVRGTGKQYNYEISVENGNPACPPPRRYFNQLYSIQFVPLKGNLAFSLTQKFNPGKVYVDRQLYNVIFDCESPTIDFRDLADSYYIDSLTINSISYNKINIFLTNIRNEIEVSDTSYRLLYNKPYGVLYIKSAKQNEEFSIIPKP